MGLEKGIKHGKEKREPYRRSKRFDRTCRNHGACGYCRENRTHASEVALQAAKHDVEQYQAEALGHGGEHEDQHLWIERDLDQESEAIMQQNAEGDRLKDLRWALQAVIDEWVGGNGKDCVCIYCCMKHEHNDRRCPCWKAEELARKHKLDVKTLADYRKEYDRGTKNEPTQAALLRAVPTETDQG